MAQVTTRKRKKSSKREFLVLLGEKRKKREREKKRREEGEEVERTFRWAGMWNMNNQENGLYPVCPSRQALCNVFNSF